MTPRQLRLLPPPRTDHGGGLRAGQRKLARPFSPKLPLHVVLRSSRARGRWSLVAGPRRFEVEDLVRAAGRRFGVRIHQFANVGNHLHLLLQARERRHLQAFLRYVPGAIALLVTQARKGEPRGKFWDGLAYSRLVSLGRDFMNVAGYVKKNLLEGMGLLTRAEKRELRLWHPDWGRADTRGGEPIPV